jgi:hypothetical protein
VYSPQANPLYAIAWDPSGMTGPFTIASVVSTPVECSKPAQLSDATADSAIVATSLPFVLTGGDITHSTGYGDWVKLTLPDTMTQIRVQSSGDPTTGVAVSLYDSTPWNPAGRNPIDTQYDTGSLADHTFTGLQPGTYYVRFERSNPVLAVGSGTTYTGIVRALP